MIMNEQFSAVSPTVKALAEYYGFTIEWLETHGYWVVNGGEGNSSINWNSSETEQDFLNKLKDYFVEVGEDRVRDW